MVVLQEIILLSQPLGCLGIDYSAVLWLIKFNVEYSVQLCSVCLPWPLSERQSMVLWPPVRVTDWLIDWSFHWTDEHKHVCKTCTWIIVLDFLMTFSWLSHGFLMTFSIISHDILMIFSWLSHDFLKTFSWLSHDSLMRFSWITHDFLIILSWLSHDFLLTFSWVSHDFFITFSWHSHDFLMNFSWVSNEFLMSF